jgi:hypothetical protein
MGDVSHSLGDLRMPAFSLSVARAETRGGFEWFMRWLGTFCCVVMNLVQKHYQTL